MRGVKRQAPDGIGMAAIGFVASNGVAAFGQMDADLMFASSFKPHFDECGPWISLQDANVRGREFSGAGFSSR